MTKSASASNASDVLTHRPVERTAGELIVERVLVYGECRLAWLRARSSDSIDALGEFSWWRQTSRDGRTFRARAAQIEAELAATQAGAARRKIVSVFGLNDAEADVLDLCAAVRIDPAIIALIAELGTRYASDRLARQIFARHRDRRLHRRMRGPDPKPFGPSRHRFHELA